MKTTDLFAFNRSSKRLNESLAKTFGRKINLETFSVEQLEDARNKLRTQIYTARSSSNFNETVDNDTLSQAQFMHDAIVAELAERDEPIVDNTIYEGPDIDKQQLMMILKQFDENMNEIGGYGDPNYDKILAALSQGDIESAVDEMAYRYADQDGGEIRSNDFDNYLEDLEDQFKDLVGGSNDDEGGETDDAYAMASAGHGSDEDYGSFNQGESLQNEAYINNAEDAINLLAAIRKQSKMAERGGGEPVRPNQLVNDLWDVMQWIEANMKESIQTELSTNTLKSYQDKAGKDIVNTMTSGDYMTTDKSAKKVMNRMKGSERADNKIYKKENESIEQTGDNMSNLREGEIQQASAIVTAKTMVDRVGRWIEELSGMENDTLLQLGDSIRDEMSQEQAKAFIEAVAPAIQQALETLKGTRDTLSSGVRSLASGEQPADMLGAEPGADMTAPAEPDAMNAEPEMDMGDEGAGDDFAAAEPAAGGLGDAGREQRESIDRQSRLLKVLAG